MVFYSYKEAIKLAQLIEELLGNDGDTASINIPAYLVAISILTRAITCYKDENDSDYLHARFVRFSASNS